MFGSNSRFKLINKKLDRIAKSMEVSKLLDYVYYLENPRKMLFPNFIGGVARGFGVAIGFTILTAVIIYILQWIVKWNLPVIGKFISEVVDIVQNNLQKAGT